MGRVISPIGNSARWIGDAGNGVAFLVGWRGAGVVEQ